MLEEELRQEIISHYRSPQGYGRPATIFAKVEEHNRTCGDRIELFLAPKSLDHHPRLFFEGVGCSLCMASASMMVGLLASASSLEAAKAYETFQKVSAEEGAATEPGLQWKIYGELRAYPVRARCVRLPWLALKKLLPFWEGEGDG